MKTLFKLPLALLVFSVLASCSPASKFAYIRDMQYGVDYPASKAPELTLQSEDVLNITVLASDKSLADPFNSWTSASGLNETTVNTYTVDSHGNIDFPVLGTIKVEGKTVDEVKRNIAGEISGLGYIKEPVVIATINNFAVSVIGEKNTILRSSGQSMNIIQALAMLDIPRESTRLKDVMVIRTENGIRRAYSVNLQSMELFDSPVYYLQQNDVIYFKPKGIRTSQTGITLRSAVSNIFSMLTPFAYLSLWFK